MATMSSAETRPRFSHDCDRCCFTGHYIAEGREVDGWFCAGAVLGGSIILRYGDGPPDYSSIPLVVAMNCIDDHLDSYRRVLADYNKMRQPARP
jgi:hypothetical protein